MKDLFGQAIYDYHFNNSPENLYTETTISEEDEMEISYLFREFNEMPIIEQKAITLSKGKISIKIRQLHFKSFVISLIKTVFLG